MGISSRPIRSKTSHNYRHHFSVLPLITSFLYIYIYKKKIHRYKDKGKDVETRVQVPKPNIQPKRKSRHSPVTTTYRTAPPILPPKYPLLAFLLPFILYNLFIHRRSIKGFFFFSFFFFLLVRTFAFFFSC